MLIDKKCLILQKIKQGKKKTTQCFKYLHSPEIFQNLLFCVDYDFWNFVEIFQVFTYTFFEILFNLFHFHMLFSFVLKHNVVLSNVIKGDHWKVGLRT